MAVESDDTILFNDKAGGHGKASDWDIEGWKEVCRKLDLETPPVGVKYSTKPPDEIAQLGGTMRLCEMLRHAQEGNAFYAAPENHLCGAAAYALGKDLPPVYTSGEYGAGLEIFDSARTASRLYDHIPRLETRRDINYVTLSPLRR